MGLPKRTNDLPLSDMTSSGYRFAMVPRRMESESISEFIGKTTGSAANDSDTASRSSQTTHSPRSLLEGPLGGWALNFLIQRNSECRD